MNKTSLVVHGGARFSVTMRIADVSAFYSPLGGGVKTYVEAKLKAAPRYGHEMVVIVPGEEYRVTQRGPGAFLAELPSPQLPVDRRYRYFDNEALLHATLDRWRPDHVEASSPWSSATMVGRWDGAASRSLMMHADPLASYAYRWFGAMATTETIDGWFGWFWRHLRGLGHMFDTVVCANGHLTERLAAGGVSGAETIRMGVERGLFSPKLRSAEERSALLKSLGLSDEAMLLIAVGRLAAEKRWEMVIRAAGQSGRQRPIGLILVGDGARRDRLIALSRRYRHIQVGAPIGDRQHLATLLANCDALVHGCESETFCLVAAEARASGLPLIVPDRGGAADQVADGAGMTYRAADQRSLEQAILAVAERGIELQRAAAVRASKPRTMEEHFADLFERYAELSRGGPIERPAAAAVAAGAA